MKPITPEEREAATSLANWLEGVQNQDVEPEILEAIYVLSPEHCPVPRVGLEDVLGRVEFGPFGDKAEAEGTEDDALFMRELLDHSGAVPQTSLEMILARVEAGPFAGMSQLEAEETLEEELPDNVIRPRAWWQRTEVAVVAAAAAALLILIPSNFEVPEQEMISATLELDVSEEKSVAKDASQEIEQTVQRAKREVNKEKEPRSDAPTESLTEPEERRSKKAKKKAEISRTLVEQAPASRNMKAKALEPQKPRPEPKRQEAQSQIKSPSIIVEEKAMPADELRSVSIARAEDMKAVNETPANSSLSAGMNNLERLAKKDSAKNELKEEIADAEATDLDVFEIEEIVVADADFIEEEMVDEIMLEPTSKSRLERRSKDFRNGMSRENASAPQKESMAENEAPAPAMDDAEKAEEANSGLLNTADSFDEISPQEFEEDLDDMVADAKSQQIVEQLSSAEKQAIQEFGTPAEIASYAQNFDATKSLAVLWQGTVKHENSFSIDVLKYSVQFPTGQKKYLERNYQLLVSLLVQEGRDSEAEVYRQKLNALK